METGALVDNQQIIREVSHKHRIGRHKLQATLARLNSQETIKWITVLLNGKIQHGIRANVIKRNFQQIHCLPLKSK